MEQKICPYCGRSFKSSRYHSDQRVCSSTECQRRRRTDYHRKKLVDDPAYREQCRDSQRNWREKNPDYMQRYRARARRAERRRHDEQGTLLRRLREVVKNNVAVDLRSTDAEIWLVWPSNAVYEKNIFAGAKVIVLQGNLLALAASET